MQQAGSQHSHISNYGAGPLHHQNFTKLQHVTVTPRESFNDPLGVAERGKVGLPPSSSECSSNSSVEASVESNMGLVNGIKKGKYYILHLILRTFGHFFYDIFRPTTNNFGRSFI